MTYTDARFVPGAAPRPMTGPTYRPQDPNAFGSPFGGPPGPPRAAPRKDRALRNRIVAGVLAASVVLGGGAWFVAASGTASADVQSVSYAGDAPFTAPVGADQPDVAGSDATGPQSGTAAGTYAATTPPSCDGDALVAALQADPAKAGAWAQVEGIAPAEIPSYVKSLSPAVLRADTAVTDHGFRDGHFTEAPAVLAQGTAVLVSSYGQPTVKCFNGNPLTPATGPVADAVTITPSATVTATLVFSSVDGGGRVTTPAPTPVGPTPAQISAAQKARDDANAAARNAVALRTKANDAQTASQAAATQAAKDKTALSQAETGLNTAKSTLGAVQSQITSINNALLNPALPPGLRQFLKNKLTTLQTKDLPAAISDVASKTVTRDEAKTKSDASAADAATKKQAADDAKTKADQAQTTAEQKEKEAQQKEKDAGLPTPKESKQENALKDQADLAKVSNKAQKLTTDAEDTTTTAQDGTVVDGAVTVDPSIVDPTTVDPATVPEASTAGTTPSGAGEGTSTSSTGTSTSGTSTAGTSAGTSTAGQGSSTSSSTSASGS